jgi:hypothetical protein
MSVLVGALTLRFLIDKVSTVKVLPFVLFVCGGSFVLHAAQSQVYPQSNTESVVALFCIGRSSL